MAYLRTKIQSTRSSQTSTSGALGYRISYFRISIHKVFADLDSVTPKQLYLLCNFNPRGLRRPRQTVLGKLYAAFLFQSTRSSQTSTISSKTPGVPFQFQSTRSSQTSTLHPAATGRPLPISIHEVFADLDSYLSSACVLRIISIHEVFADLDRFPRTLRGCFPDFNPRGLRRPRRRPRGGREPGISISIHEVFADLDSGETPNMLEVTHFNPRGLRRPRH